MQDFKRGPHLHVEGRRLKGKVLQYLFPTTMQHIGNWNERSKLQSFIYLWLIPTVLVLIASSLLNQCGFLKFSCDTNCRRSHVYLNDYCNSYAVWKSSKNTPWAGRLWSGCGMNCAAAYLHLGLPRFYDKDVNIPISLLSPLWLQLLDVDSISLLIRKHYIKIWDNNL